MLKPKPVLRRLIPAHAGKTAPSASTAGSSSAHPRSRGENLRLAEEGMDVLGSSPLTRGKRHHLRRLTLPGRLIPAHAGKTRSMRARRRPRAAHPRSRGENIQPEAILERLTGSSPLTRGKRSHGHDLQSRGRLIPAHAGKTACAVPGTCAPRAHPRSRGENRVPRAFDDFEGGSSPLTRGKLRISHFSAASIGLIPAHAGKTTLIRGWTTLLTAHPRSRGENYVDVVPSMKGFGSSPLTRGKRQSQTCHKK